MDFRRGIETITLQNGKTLDVRKGILGYSVVYPYKNIDGSWNWFNVFTGGSYRKLALSIFLVIIILLFLFNYSEALRIANECISRESIRENFTNSILNLSNITIIN